MDDLTRLLLAAGCPAEQAEEIRRLCEEGETRPALFRLKRHRCELMDALHERQEQVDRLDLLLREIERTARQGKREERMAKR